MALKWETVYFDRPLLGNVLLSLELLPEIFMLVATSLGVSVISFEITIDPFIN